MITYNDLYDILRKEKYSEPLQALPKNFISDVAVYLKEKKEIASKDEDIFSGALIKTKKQFENAISIFKELMLRRKKKLLNLVFVAAETGISKRDYENMLDFEKNLFEKIMKNFEETEKIASELMNGKKKNKNILVSFKEDVSEFLDMNAEKLGPFKKGDIANLPREIVKILEDDGKVEEIGE